MQLKPYDGSRLYPIEESARILGGLSPWTLRAHIRVGNIKVVRVGTRVMLNSAEIERVTRQGLPKLTTKPACEMGNGE